MNQCTRPTPTVPTDAASPTPLAVCPRCLRGRLAPLDRQARDYRPPVRCNALGCGYEARDPRTVAFPDGSIAASRTFQEALGRLCEVEAAGAALASDTAAYGRWQERQDRAWRTVVAAADYWAAQH